MYALIFGSRSAGSINNYITMARDSRRAMDKLSEDVRFSSEIIDVTPANKYTNLSAVTFTNYHGDQIKYVFSNTNTLVRISNSVTEVMMSACTGKFNLYQPFLKSNSWNLDSDPASLKDVGIVVVSWRSTRKAAFSQTNTEDVVTARILMRNCSSL